VVWDSGSSILESFSVKIPIQNVRNEEFAHIMLKLPTQCNDTSSKSLVIDQVMQCVGSCSEPIVDKLVPCFTNLTELCFQAISQPLLIQKHRY